MNEASVILRAVSDALAKVADELETAVNPVADVKPKKAAATAKKAAIKKKEVEPQSTEEKVAEEESKAEEPVALEQDEKAEPVTLEQIHSVLQEKRSQGKKDKFKDLFSSFGVQRLPDVKPDDYPALLEAAEAL